MDCLADLKTCEKRCDEGDGAYCRQLYVFHRDGQAVPENAAIAEVYRDKACKLGDEWSCNSGSRFHRKLKPELLPSPTGDANIAGDTRITR